MANVSTMQTLSNKWVSARPTIYGLGLGLLLGPFLTNYLGWQVTTGKASADMRAAVVESQAMVCNARARGDVAEPGKLDWSGRTDLAKKWAMMPGSTSADPDVARACADKLAV